MIIGIVVEGDHDSAVYRELIRRIGDDIEDVPSRPCGGHTRLMEQFVGLLKAFEWGSCPSVNKAIVIRDSDCSDPAGWERRMQQKLDQSRFRPSFPVHFHATKCEIESWLLADENAINRVSAQRGKNRGVPPVTIQLESRKDAKELFAERLSEAKLPADPAVYQEIARASDISRIAARCPHFQRFVEKVRSC